MHVWTPIQSLTQTSTLPTSQKSSHSIEEQLLPKSKAALHSFKTLFTSAVWQDVSQSLSNAQSVCVQWVELLRAAPDIPITSLPSFPISSHTYNTRIFVAREEAFFSRLYTYLSLGIWHWQQALQITPLCHGSSSECKVVLKSPLENQVTTQPWTCKHYLVPDSRLETANTEMDSAMQCHLIFSISLAEWLEVLFLKLRFPITQAKTVNNNPYNLCRCFPLKNSIFVSSMVKYS